MPDDEKYPGEANARKKSQGLALFTAGCFIAFLLMVAGGTNELGLGVGGPLIIAGVIRFVDGTSA